MDTTFVPGTVITSDWLNEVNDSVYNYTASVTGAVAQTSTDKLREIISVKDFGAVGDGVTDDTVALQAALDSNRPVLVPAGKYRTTASLLVDPIRNRNCGFFSLSSAPSRYPYTQQPSGPLWDGLLEPTLFYDGATSTTAAVIIVSAEAVGVEPASSFANTIWGFLLQGLNLDANSKAGFGLYCARVQDLQLFRLKVRGATVAGVSVNGTYSGSARSVHCYLNPGRGFELGAEDIRNGWATNDKVNAFYLHDLHCEGNGSNGTFREADPLLLQLGCGFYFGPHRGAVADGVVCENNFGANIIYAPSGAGNVLQGVYTELGCKYAPGGAGTDAISLGYATKQWGIIYVGIAAAYHNRVQDMACAIDEIWMTGTSPTAAREEGAFELYNIVLSGGIKADWAAYRLVNCAVELETITGTQPAGAYTILGGLQFGAGKNILDVYEEGTFTPTIEGSTTPGAGWTYSLQSGGYTKIGRQVFISGRIVVTGIGAGAAGSVLVKGLPFAVNASNIANSAMAISSVSNMTTSIVSLTGTAQVGTSQFLLFHRTAAAASETQTQISNISATLAFTFSGSYIAA